MKNHIQPPVCKLGILPLPFLKKVNENLFGNFENSSGRPLVHGRTVNLKTCGCSTWKYYSILPISCVISVLGRSMGEIIHTLTVHRLISLHPIPDCRILKIGVAMDQIGTAVLFVELPGSSR